MGVSMNNKLAAVVLKGLIHRIGINIHNGIVGTVGTMTCLTFFSCMVRYTFTQAQAKL